MHWLRVLAASTPAAPDNSVKIAIITALSVVVAAAITAYATTFTRHHRSDDDGPTEQDYVAELLRRAEVAERRFQRVEQRNESLIERVDDLERYCWRNGIDPNDGHSVFTPSEKKSGEESS